MSKAPYRDYLFGIAYRMVGTVRDAEDLVQETYVRWQGVDVHTVDHPKAYLASILTRLCIDHLRSARVRRETYVGTWLPEPLVEGTADPPERAIELAESLHMAFLVVLEQLSPTERAVFLLHDVFDYSYAEVAAWVGKTEANCRQIARRARAHMAHQRPRFEVRPQEHAAMLEQFLQAVQDGNLDGLLRLLAPDATLYSDGGGKAIAARKPIHGAEKIAHFFARLAAKAAHPVAVERVSINADVGVLIFEKEHLTTVITLQIEQEHIRAIYTVRNPDKLRHVAR